MNGHVLFHISFLQTQIPVKDHVRRFLQDFANRKNQPLRAYAFLPGPGCTVEILWAGAGAKPGFKKGDPIDLSASTNPDAFRFQEVPNPLRVSVPTHVVNREGEDDGDNDGSAASDDNATDAARVLQNARDNSATMEIESDYGQLALGLSNASRDYTPLGPEATAVMEAAIEHWAEDGAPDDDELEAIFDSDDDDDETYCDASCADHIDADGDLVLAGGGNQQCEPDYDSFSNGVMLADVDMMGEDSRSSAGTAMSTNGNYESDEEPMVPRSNGLARDSSGAPLQTPSDWLPCSELSPERLSVGNVAFDPAQPVNSITNNPQIPVWRMLKGCTSKRVYANQFFGSYEDWMTRWQMAQPVDAQPLPEYPPAAAAFDQQNPRQAHHSMQSAAQVPFRLNGRQASSSGSLRKRARPHERNIRRRVSQQLASMTISSQRPKQRRVQRRSERQSLSPIVRPALASMLGDDDDEDDDDVDF